MPFPLVPLTLGLLSTLSLLLVPTDLSAWQQRVEYTMEIELLTDNHWYNGQQRLVYHNNSPDTLREVYYHLFYEAFKPGSMMDLRDRALKGSLRINELSEDQQGKVLIDSLAQDGEEVRWRVYETILHAELATPLLPGDSTVLQMKWTTRIPRLRRRGGWMSSEGIEYSMAQWYPKLAEYDGNGWHNDEYVSREFHGVYGTFDVAITLPATYVVGATGKVMNPEEVGCGYELEGIDTTILRPASGEGKKRWRFHAENVHDFAWVADRDYVHQIAHWGEVTIHVLVEQRYLGRWSDAGLWTALLMDYFSRRFGRYDWPQFTVAQAGDGGMEYPQLIMITGYRTPASLAGVIAHELGHQWYYGMLGNNETQEAWLDEGFAQYLTNEASRDVFGLRDTTNPLTGIERVVYPWIVAPWQHAESYYALAVERYDEALDTYHDRFRENATSGLVYSKGEAVLRQLQYMLGDSLFDASMRHYYDKWKFRHPGTRDFEGAIEEASGLKLDWFFNQWINSTKRCDYALDALGSEPDTQGFSTTVELSNRDEIVMPIDITLTYDDGSTAVANIPVEEWRKPGVDFNLPRWKWIAREYTVSFTTPRRVVRATIDTTTLLLDLDRTNNTARSGFLADLLPPSQIAFYRRWDFDRPLESYSIRLRPTLWYSKADGAQLGFVADGGYAYNRYNSKAGVYYNIGSGRVDYDLRYRTPFDLLGRYGEISLLATNSDGVQRWKGSIAKRVDPYNYGTADIDRFTLSAEREVLVGPNYPNDVAAWNGGGYNTLGLSYNMTRQYPSSNIALSAGAMFDASFASRSEFTQLKINGVMQWNWRSPALLIVPELFLGASLGQPPAQRLFNAAGATSRDMHLNEVHRLAMNIDPGFARRNHLVLPTQGYLLSLSGTDSGRLVPNLLNARLSVGNINPFKRIIQVPVLREFDLQLYGAGGWIFQGDMTLKGFSDFNWEVGASASIDLIDAFLPDVYAYALDTPAPLRLSFYAPLLAGSKLLSGKGFAYRWAIGISM